MCFNGACTGADCSTFTPATCGSTNCDVRSNTCCITLSTSPTGRCVSGTTSSCNSSEATFHCRYSCDCPAGQSCCGTLNPSNLLSGGDATCQTVAPGGSCTPPPGLASAQLCLQDEECQNGAKCIYQSCTIFGANFHLCGLQSQSPYNCKAN